MSSRMHIEGRRKFFSDTYDQIRPATIWEFRDDLWWRVGRPVMGFMADQRILTGGFEEINA
jgi:hypothetical protein